jgi:hypothetical protein
VHVGEDGADKPDNSGVIGEDAHDPGPALDLLGDA